MKKLIYIFCLLFVIQLSAQDFPHSLGPAPFVNNTSPVSEVFTGANPNSRQIVCINSSSNSGQKYIGLLFSCTNITPRGAPINYFPSAYTRVTPKWHYVLDFYNQRLIRMDTLGSETILGNITGAPLPYLTGMTWDATTGQMFIIATSLTASRLGRLDTTTRVITPIGDSSARSPSAISLSCSPAGTLFVIDIVRDSLYRVNKTTGVFTAVGPLGGNANFGQDAQFDYDGILYWAAYTTGPQLRVLDTTNGSSILTCFYAGVQATAISTIPHVIFPPYSNYCRFGLNKLIADHSLTRDSLFVIAGSNCRVVDLDVRIDTLLHTRDSDLSFYLIKDTIGVRIINRAGGLGDNFIGTFLDDEAEESIDSAAAPFWGFFRPSSPLSVFDLKCIDGYWKLLISDTLSGDTGFLKAWCVRIYFNCSGPNCLTGGIETVEIPNSYRLYQNYPNPFNPTTKIKFGLPENANVKLVVFDALGKEVAVLVNEYKTANTYEVDFYGSHLPSGVYFYKLESEDFTVTKKMLLIK